MTRFKTKILQKVVTASAALFLLCAYGCSQNGGLDDLRSERAKLRAYDGAPPVIPHEVSSGKYSRCLYCHKEGRVFDSQAAPAAPHPEMKNCRQCHVPRLSDDLFTENSFEPYRITTRLPGNNPAGPPKIPHRLQYREKCEVCHLGETAPEALKPRHGERGNCVQCHVHMEDVRLEIR